MITIAPSILSADFANLGRDVQRVREADWLHVDVMDGMFVSNISIGVPVVKSLRKFTDQFLDVHLMIEKPVRYVDAFADAGADLLTVHLEADMPPGIQAALAAMERRGVRKGIALRPITAAEAVLPYLDKVDLILVMTVEPGFGGQAFMADQLPKIAAIRRYIQERNPACRLEVDGGVDPVTARQVVEAGADVLVAGSAIYGAPDPAQAIRASEKRDGSVVCVVADPKDVIAMERAREYHGTYHVLHGVLSPMNGVGPDDLYIKSLLDRVAQGEIQEVIMATNPDTEGEATAMYLSRMLKPFGVKVTRLAYGVPVGGHLEYADDATLMRALEGRREM